MATTAAALAAFGAGAAVFTAARLGLLTLGASAAAGATATAAPTATAARAFATGAALFAGRGHGGIGSAAEDAL
jgi:hypothetical protein